MQCCPLPLLFACLNQTDELIKIWDSIADAAEFLTGNRKQGTRITAACKGKYKSAMGYKWEYYFE